MREPLFCKRAVPAPSAKNSYIAGGSIGAAEGPAERGIGATGESPSPPPFLKGDTGGFLHW